MKSLALAFCALLALNGVVAAPARPPPPADDEPVVTVTVTHTVTKVYGVTATEWVPPSKPTQSTYKKKPTTTTTQADPTTTTSTTTTSTTSSDKETTTTTETTTSSTTTTAEPTTTTTTTTEDPIPTPTPTPPPETTTPPPPPPPPQTTTTTEEEKAPVNVDLTSQPSTAPETSSQGGMYGDATYYDVGMGSCGIESTPSDMIVALSWIKFDPFTPNGNPNKNTLCGKQLKCTRDGKNPTVVVVTDRCTGCKEDDFDFSDAAYKSLGGTVEEGRFKITCVWL